MASVFKNADESSKRMAEDQIQAIDAGDLFHDLVWLAIVKLVTGRLIAMIPFLGWGPLGIFTGWVVGVVMGWVYDAVKMAVELQLIHLKNEEHQRAFDSASLKLKLVARTHGVNSQEFKKAREENAKALAVFVTFGPK